MATLVPDYLNIDFNTILQKFKEDLQNSDTFADYNFEGSNITLLMELNAYIAELTSYFVNKIAKNIHMETADVYECINRASRQFGYEPRGYRSSKGTLTVSVSGVTVGDYIKISPFTQLESTEQTDEGDTIKVANTLLYSAPVTGSVHNFSVYIRQGEVQNITGYTGDDLIDDELLLPDDYAFDDDIQDDIPTIAVYVNGEPWTRVEDFYDELSPLYDEDNVYMFVYDRYRRNKVVFNSARNVPATTDTIQVYALKSLGADGNLASNTITTVPTNFIYNMTRSRYVDTDKITINNPSALTGGSEPDNSTQIKNFAKAAANRQKRNVTAQDYRSHLEERSDVDVGQAWGEQEVAPSGSVLEYNKVHISVIPDQWGSGTITVSSGALTTNWGLSGAAYVPQTYSSEYTDSIKTYLEPRKHLSAYEIFEVPQLVYFSFDFGVRLKRLYEIEDVAQDIKDKLAYYFTAESQDFNSIINFNDIIEYILDPTEVSSTNEFANVKGIRNLNLRDIWTNLPIYESNTVGNYPYYVDSPYTGKENQLRRIQLGLNQFPVLLSGSLRVLEEN